MVDYKEMYFNMAREVARAIEILVEVQQQCEERYIEDKSAVVVLLDSEENQK